jgi:Fic family protein
MTGPPVIAMHPDQLARNAPGRLLRSSRGEGAFWYFVPAPLPPKLGYTPRLVHLLERAAAGVGELAGVGRTLANPHILVCPFIRREAVASSRIEGTVSDLPELLAYEARLARPGADRTDDRDADVREVLNYVHALEYALGRLAELPVSLRLICEVHERLVHDVRGNRARLGQFRTVQNWIGPPGSRVTDATYVPPAVPEMHEALGLLERYLHAEVEEPQLVRLALIHYQFEAIHPFVDGNGRIGRLLMSLLAVTWGILPLPLLYLSSAIEKRRDEYYRLLLGVSQRGGWEDWVAFFLEIVASASLDALERGRRLQDLRREWRERFQQAKASALTLRLIDSLFERPMLTIRDAQAALGLRSYNGARKHIVKLVEAGILAELPEASPSAFYGAKQILRVLQ